MIKIIERGFIETIAKSYLCRKSGGEDVDQGRRHEFGICGHKSGTIIEGSLAYWSSEECQGNLRGGAWLAI